MPASSTSPPRGRIIALIAAPVAVYATVRAALWLARWITRLACEVWSVAPWIGLGALGLLAAVLAITGDQRARQSAPVEPHGQDYAPAAPVEPAPPRPCAYGPTCPRCTGVGTLGGTALDHPPAVEPAPAPPIPLPARPARRPRKVA